MNMARMAVLICFCGGCGFQDLTLVTSRDAGAPNAPDATNSGLFDRGLVARFFLDEARQGQDPASVSDSATNLQIPIAYAGRDQPSFLTESGHRGLRWVAPGQGGVICRPVQGTPWTALDGEAQATLEAVIDLEFGVTSGSRIVHVGYEEIWTIGLGYMHETFGLVLRINEHQNLREASWPVNLATQGRVVVTAVYDGSAAGESDRTRLYIDGERLGTDRVPPIPQNERIDLVQNQSSLCIGNRAIGERSPDGAIFYAALYRRALSDGEIRTHAQRLRATDDP